VNVTDETIDLRIYLRAVEAGGDMPSWQPLIDAARGCGVAETRVIEGLLGVGSRGMVKPSNWVMRREIPVIVDLRGNAESINVFLGEKLSQVLPSGTAASEAYAGLDRQTIDAGLPNFSAELGAMLRLTVGDNENYDGTVLHEAVIHVVRGLGLAGATVYRGDMPDANEELPVVIEVVDLPPAVAELARCLGDIVEASRIVSTQVAMIRWSAAAATR
jgi:PII-like signaling protein